MKSDYEYHLLGMMGDKIGEGIPVFVGLPAHISSEALRNLGAQLNTSGAYGMYHIVGFTPEAPTQEAADLSAVPGGDGVSVWARSGMEWAAAYGLLPLPTDDQLRPSADVTREEMAMVLYTYDQLFVNQEQPETLLRSAPEL